MNKYSWKIINRGFGTEYQGEIRANSKEESVTKIIENHERNYNHYSYEIFISSENKQEEFSYKIVCGKIEK